MGLFFEDLTPGASREAGPIVVDEASIIDFAKKFDPQPFHLDREAAKRSIYGGLIASGWHTAAVAHRLVVEIIGEGSGSEGSPGGDQLRWLQPVRAGDALRLKATVIEARESKSKPSLGIVKLAYEVKNQDDVVVMTMIGVGMFRKRG